MAIARKRSKRFSLRKNSISSARKCCQSNDSKLMGYFTRATKWLSQFKIPCWRWTISFNLSEKVWQIRGETGNSRVLWCFEQFFPAQPPQPVSRSYAPHHHAAVRWQCPDASHASHHSGSAQCPRPNVRDVRGQWRSQWGEGEGVKFHPRTYVIPCRPIFVPGTVKHCNL